MFITFLLSQVFPTKLLKYESFDAISVNGASIMAGARTELGTRNTEHGTESNETFIQGQCFSIANDNLYLHQQQAPFPIHITAVSKYWKHVVELQLRCSVLPFQLHGTWDQPKAHFKTFSWRQSGGTANSNCMERASNGGWKLRNVEGQNSADWEFQNGEFCQRHSWAISFAGRKDSMNFSFPEKLIHSHAVRKVQTFTSCSDKSSLAGMRASHVFTSVQMSCGYLGDVLAQVIKSFGRNEQIQLFPHLLASSKLAQYGEQHWDLYYALMSITVWLTDR